ncbi:alsin homolog [Sitodiplosis mosellana]|uniref:alsin homolog n=1 Tax=Sitodiplosis mosellana TaxID=263140 RepID=UPI002443A693|nr:alsin homolog [Sitodiplosis mosellana]XP_055309143.1 alsin homolog [Sitodiplosis mosellana]
MCYFKIYHSGHELNVVNSQPIDNITKIASHNNHVFMLTTAKQLFFGTPNGNGPQADIQFELIRENVIDVACSVDSVYVVDENGSVQHCPLMAFDFDKRWNDIPIMNYGAIYEGVTSNGCNVIRVLEVCCNDDGALFITADRELYAVGSFNDVCTSDQPIKVAQFINYEILQVAMGKHFAVILTRKRTSQPFHSSASHANHIDSSSCDDSMASLDNSLAHASITENGNESLASTPQPLDTNFDMHSLNSVNLSNLKTVTNNTTDTESSSPEHSLAFDVEHAIGRLLKTNGQIQTQVWCFGSINQAGQLGVGDHVKRMHAVEVVSLRDQGVVQVCSGDEYTAALTLDARLYLWGDNSNEQISHWLEKEDYSSPKRFYKPEQNIFGVQCGQHSTFILTNNLDRYELSRNKHFPSINISHEYTDDYGQHQSDYLLLASRQYLVVGTVYRPLRFEKYLEFEQQFLQDILQNTRKNIEHFLRTLSRNIQIKHPQLYRQFAQQYNSITELAAKNIASLLKFACQKCDHTAIAFIQHHTEYVHLFRQYCKLYCETICSDDFVRASQIIIPNADFTSKFSIPLQHTANYVDFIRELIEVNGGENGLYLKSVLSHWEKYRHEVDEMLKSANLTINFWTANQKVVPPTLQIPERRFIMDSKEFSLKLLPSSRFKSNWFILFNDIFCHSTGSSSSLKQYSLKTLWISNVVDKDVSPSSSSSSSSSNVRKYAFKIITPEEQFLVSAPSNDVKLKWLQAFEYHIKDALGKVNSKSTFVRRTTAYTFSDKHRIYPLCKYLGQWYYGKMDGIGCIEYPDARIYTGQIKMNSITGYGRLTCPNSDCYEGRFVEGKFDGFGTLETHQSNENYEGHFKNGQKNGFGILIDNMRTYIGEFMNGSPCGYGVVDDADSGEKYMGIFKDGHRCGHGFCITADGKYFEGNFVDNELNGNGIAMFTDGSYYEGDLSISGPNGRGTLYLPVELLQTEYNFDMDIQKSMVRGSVLSGSLSGCWENVKINNGSISISQEFTKYPSQIGEHQIDSKSKWSALFTNWEHDVFGASMSEINDTKELWIKISDYSDTVKQTEVLKSTISTSAILYKSGGGGGGSSLSNKIYQESSQTNHFLLDTTSSQNDYHVSKSLSLSRITGKNYKRNLLAVERPKSLSNEFLNNAVNFSSDVGVKSEEAAKGSSGAIKNDRLELSTALKSPIPCFGISKLDANDLRLIRDYLTKAFKNQYHPLGILNSKVSYCFYTSYGCWKVKPISVLSTHAMHEWESISRRIYIILRKLFPTLPQEYGTLDDEFISHRSLLYPILLSEGVYSTLFVLYANKCSKRDEIYRQRIQSSEKKTDDELMEFLKLSGKYLPLIKNDEFTLAILALQQVKEKFCPREMLHLIEKTFKHVEAAAEISKSTTEHLVNDDNDDAERTTTNDTEIVQLNADNMMPLTIFLLLRAAIPHLGTEILLLEDLMGPDFEFVMNGFAGYCFTTIKAAYQHIINDSFLQ